MTDSVEDLILYDSQQVLAIQLAQAKGGSHDAQHLQWQCV